MTGATTLRDALPPDDAAQVLGISSRTANRLWTFARAWLRERIQGAGRDDNAP
jgi:hypothetical protein